MPFSLSGYKFVLIFERLIQIEAKRKKTHINIKHSGKKLK